MHTLKRTVLTTRDHRKVLAHPPQIEHCSKY